MERANIDRAAVEPSNARENWVAQPGGIVRFLAFVGLERGARTRFLIEES